MSKVREELIFLPLTADYPFPISNDLEAVVTRVSKDSQIQAVLSALVTKPEGVQTEVLVAPNKEEDILDKNEQFSKRKSRFNTKGFICKVFIEKFIFENDMEQVSRFVPINLIDNNLKALEIRLVPIVEAYTDINRLSISEVSLQGKSFNSLKGKVTENIVINDISELEATHLQAELSQQVQEYIAAGNGIESGEVNYLDYKTINIKLEDYPSYIFKHLHLSVRYFKRFFEKTSLKERYIDLTGYLRFTMNRNALDISIQSKVRENIDKGQKNFYLAEQIKVLKKELNNGKPEFNDKESLTKKLHEARLPTEIHEKIENEINRLDQIPNSTSEAYIQRNYIEWVLNTPFHGDKLEKIDLKRSREILDADHFGLEDVKERVLEYLAVLSRMDLTKSPILCLIGPPGVGKTSLGQSIAKATGRKYTRFALGGVSDEAEIRGHRRTYLGSQPGKIIQRLVKTKVNNPLFLLDEIDKLSSNQRGDPASALLEVLDPEQNFKFSDNYLEVDYDLSKVLFVATANSYNIPPALLDRMEIIDLGSYTNDEKFEIAKRHILPKLIKRNGIKTEELEFPDRIINFIIDGYTNEPGVRSLERRIERVLRYVIKSIIETKQSKIIVDENLVETVLGPIINEMYEKVRDGSEVGLICGLAWTASGGDVLPIEAAVTKGKGRILHTGSLGDNIKESVQAALTVIRQRIDQFKLSEDFYLTSDFHIHFPNAAIKKDGPSAGAAITTVLISALTKQPIDKDIGMTGEISLMGRVLKIGGVKEKVISAHRNGVKHIILPRSNIPDLYNVPDKIKEVMEFYPVETIDEVVDIVFGNKKRPDKLVTDSTKILFEQEKEKLEQNLKRKKRTASIKSTELVDITDEKETEVITKEVKTVARKSGNKGSMSKTSGTKKATTKRTVLSKEKVDNTIDETEVKGKRSNARTTKTKNTVKKITSNKNI